jgi:hypothetical protein
VSRKSVNVLALFTAWAPVMASCLADDSKSERSLTGEFQFRNVAFADRDLVLRPRDASTRDGTPIVLYPRTDWKCLTWKVAPAGESAAFTNFFTSKGFAPKGEAGANVKSLPVVQVARDKEPGPESRWKVVAADGETCKIVHEPSGWVLSAEETESGEVRVVLRAWSGRDDQKWQKLPRPEKFSG